MKLPPNKDFTATIDRREGRHFVLVLPDSQELIVPIHHLAAKARSGDIIYLQFLTASQSRADKAELARHILEEILNGH